MCVEKFKSPSWAGHGAAEYLLVHRDVLHGRTLQEVGRGRTGPRSSRIEQDHGSAERKRSSRVRETGFGWHRGRRGLRDRRLSFEGAALNLALSRELDGRFELFLRENEALEGSVRRMVRVGEDASLDLQHLLGEGLHLLKRLTSSRRVEDFEGTAEGMIELLVAFEERVDDSFLRVGVLHARKRGVELALEANGDRVTDGEGTSLHAERTRLLQDLGAESRDG